MPAANRCGAFPRAIVLLSVERHWVAHATLNRLLILGGGIWGACRELLGLFPPSAIEADAIARPNNLRIVPPCYGYARAYSRLTDEGANTVPIIPIPPPAIAVRVLQHNTIAHVVAGQSEITDRARTEFLAWQAGAIDRSHYSTYAGLHFTDAYVAQLSPSIREYGELESVVFAGRSISKGTEIYSYHLTCSNANVQMQLGIDHSGKINQIVFRGTRRHTSQAD
jgi:hypothetical protein